MQYYISYISEWSGANYTRGEQCYPPDKALSSGSNQIKIFYPPFVQLAAEFHQVTVYLK